MTFLIELDDNYKLKKVTSGFNYDLSISNTLISSSVSGNSFEDSAKNYVSKTVIFGIHPLITFLINLAMVAILIAFIFQCCCKKRSATYKHGSASNHNILQLNQRDDIEVLFEKV